MKLKGIPVKGTRIDKSGKLVKFNKPRNASHAIAQKKSTTVRVKRKGSP